MTVVNNSGVEPVGRAVLVEYYDPEIRKSAIVIPESVERQVNSVEQRARVIAIGRSAWPDEPRRADIGDYVLISKMAGYHMKGPKDGKPYRIINDRDIFARLTYVEGVDHV